VATELVANSVLHVGRGLTLSMARRDDQLLVAVTDRSRDEPVLRPCRPAAVGGRGMQLIAGLSRQWGVRLVHPGGKTVWAALDTQPCLPV
jgi:hypothetical protein